GPDTKKLTVSACRSSPPLNGVTVMTAHLGRQLEAAFRQGVVLPMAIALLLAPQAAKSQPTVEGKWSDPFDTENVMIHASLLPTGKVLFWSRREVGQDLNPRDCTPRIWDPNLKTILPTANKPGYNLFCSGHAFLPDGCLFVAGGHAGQDGHGEPHVTIYN